MTYFHDGMRTTHVLRVSDIVFIRTCDHHDDHDKNNTHANTNNECRPLLHLNGDPVTRKSWAFVEGLDVFDTIITSCSLSHFSRVFLFSVGTVPI